MKQRPRWFRHSPALGDAENQVTQLHSTTCQMHTLTSTAEQWLEDTQIIIIHQGC
jgi:hypothetical protein